MKPKPMMLALAALLMNAAKAVDPNGLTPLLSTRAARVAAVEKEKDPAKAGFAEGRLAQFDQHVTKALGVGWLERLNASAKTEEAEMVDFYIEGHPYDYAWSKSVPYEVHEPMLQYIAAKPELTVTDIEVVKKACSPERHCPELVSRMDELLALNPTQFNYIYFDAKYSAILGLKGGFATHMTPGEWILFSTTKYNPQLYQAMRDNLLLAAVDAMTRKRKQAGEPVEGAEFEAAMAPIVTALDQPLFAGLHDAVADLGLDLPRPDYTRTVAAVNQAVEAAETRSMSADLAGSQLGTVMFVKGVTAYNAWKDTLGKP